jgi:hypothetical protein
MKLGLAALFLLCALTAFGSERAREIRDIRAEAAAVHGKWNSSLQSVISNAESVSVIVMHASGSSSELSIHDTEAVAALARSIESWKIGAALPMAASAGWSIDLSEQAGSLRTFVTYATAYFGRTGHGLALHR